MKMTDSGERLGLQQGQLHHHVLTLAHFTYEQCYKLYHERKKEEENVRNLSGTN
jgi:hypothetical protein